MKDKSNKFFSLYNNVHGRVFSYLLSLVHNRAAAEDILQDTASFMWENFDKFEEGTNFNAWAIRIAKNKAMEYLRDNKKTKKLLSDQLYQSIAETAEQESKEFNKRINALDKCMEKLSNRDQTLLQLRYSNNVSMNEISVRTGRSSSALYRNITRIYESLKVCISNTMVQEL